MRPYKTGALAIVHNPTLSGSTSIKPLALSTCQMILDAQSRVGNKAGRRAVSGHAERRGEKGTAVLTSLTQRGILLATLRISSNYMLLLGIQPMD
jgi:hypothetical protein